jgi:hypothetical protein
MLRPYSFIRVVINGVVSDTAYLGAKDWMMVSNELCKDVDGRDCGLI